MFTRIVTSALFAGALAGLIAALLQLWFVQPVLLHAELYESGTLQQMGAEAVGARPDLGGLHAVRGLLTIVFTMLTYAGYALILVALMAYADERGAQIGARTGILWGIAGFVSVHFAPAFSLPPEVPGVAAADLTARQIWWFATAFASASALWLIAFGRSWAAWGAAVVLLLVPHAIGAPGPDVLTGPAPTEIGALFAARALGVGAAAWVMLGAFAGHFWQREGARQGVTQAT